MVRRSPRCSRLKRVDHADRIALVNEIIEAFRQQCRLRPIRPCDEALHRSPWRITRRIITAATFSHTQDQGLTNRHRCRQSPTATVGTQLTTNARAKQARQPPATRLTSASCSTRAVAWPVKRDIYLQNDNK